MVHTSADASWVIGLGSGAATHFAMSPAFAQGRVVGMIWCCGGYSTIRAGTYDMVRQTHHQIVRGQGFGLLWTVA